MIEIKNISKWYGTFQVLTDCTTNIKKGEVVVVCGPSGSGKSTLIKCVNMLEPFQKGEVTVDGISVGAKGTNLAQLRAKIGMVFQNFELFPHLTITDNLIIGQMKLRTTPGGYEGLQATLTALLNENKALRERITELTQQVDRLTTPLPEPEGSPIHA